MEETKTQLHTFISDVVGNLSSPTFKESNSKITALYDIVDDVHYGVVFTKLDKSSKVELLDENQYVAEQGSNIVYQSTEAPHYLISLLSDFINDKYSLNVTVNKESSNG